MFSKHHKKDTNKFSKNAKATFGSRAKSMLDHVGYALNKEYTSKIRARSFLFYGLLAYFLIITIFVCYVVVFTQLDDYVKSILLGGFFIHLIGLFAIEFKYAFSSSEEYSRFATNLLRWAHEEHVSKYMYEERQHKRYKWRHSKHRYYDKN